MFGFGIRVVAGEWSVWSVVLALLLVVAGLMPLLYLFPGMRYRVDENVLTIGGGMWTTQAIPLSSIERISPTRSTSHASSYTLEKLRIDYRAGDRLKHVVVRPDNPRAFMADIQTRDRRLILEEDCLLRTKAPAEISLY